MPSVQQGGTLRPPRRPAVAWKRPNKHNGRVHLNHNNKQELDRIQFGFSLTAITAGAAIPGGRMADGG